MVQGRFFVLMVNWSIYTVRRYIFARMAMEDMREPTFLVSPRWLTVRATGTR